MTGIERRESYECNKPGQLREDYSMYKKRITEKGNKPKGTRVETTAAVQGVMVKTLEYEDGVLTENRFGFASELTTRVTTQHLHCLRFLDLLLNSVGTRKFTGQNVDSIR